LLTKVTVLPVLSALGVFPAGAEEPLGTSAIEWSRPFKAGNHVPFCANVIIEKLECGGGEYVRVLNNQVPIPLEGCGIGPSGFTDGLCQVEAFLKQSVREKVVESGTETFERVCGLNDITWQ
jgi:acid phosphatase